MENESDIARIARLSGLKPDQVRYDLKEHCILKGNQLEVTISDNEALKIISEKRNRLIWFKSKEARPLYPSSCLFSNAECIEDFAFLDETGKVKFYPDRDIDFFEEYLFWAYITPDMLPKGEK